jgi:hypothetical protein
MSEHMNIRPDIAFQEQAVQMQFLQQRVLVLAQHLADVTVQRDVAVQERDQAIADRDAHRQELDEALMERREEGERDGAAE